MYTALSFQNVTFLYGRSPALQNVTVDLPHGITGLLGANGAGKTTFLRLAMGLLGPAHGSILLLGRDPLRHPDARLHVGYLPQNFEAPNYLTVYDYLRSLLLLSGFTRRDAELAIDRSLELVGMRQHRHTQIKGLSGGMLRRVGLAQALAHQPRLLLLDEPTTGLDPEERVRFYQVLREVSSISPVLLSTHLVDELEKSANDVIILRSGKMVWAGSLSDAIGSVEGRVREGALPLGTTPNGRVIATRSTATGNWWRVLGGTEELPITAPSLLDAYIFYTSQQEEP